MRLSLTLNQVFFDFVAYVGGAVFAAALPPRNDGVMSPEQQMELRKLLQSKNPEDLQKANKVRNWITDFHGFGIQHILGGWAKVVISLEVSMVDSRLAWPGFDSCYLQTLSEELSFFFFIGSTLRKIIV